MAFTGGRIIRDVDYPAPDANPAYELQCADDYCGAFAGTACITRAKKARKSPHPVRVADAATEAARPACVCTHNVAWAGCFCPASE